MYCSCVYKGSRYERFTAKITRTERGLRSPKNKLSFPGWVKYVSATSIWSDAGKYRHFLHRPPTAHLPILLIPRAITIPACDKLPLSPQTLPGG
jgi:hypothetical protein